MLQKEMEHIMGESSKDAIIPVEPSTGLNLKWLQIYNRSIPNCNNKSNNMENNIYKVVPYTKVLHESFKNICSKHGIKVRFKGGSIMKKLLVAPRIKTDHTQKWSDI